jgi:hypothetical protein
VNPVLKPMAPMARIEWVALGVGMALATWLMVPLRGQVSDSTFVHLQFARHLAEGRGPVLNAGEYIYGCTSPLWAALIGDAMVLGFDGLAAAKTLGILAALATIPLFLQLTRRTIRHAPVRAFATIAWSSNAWMSQWSNSGLETPLAVALTLAGFVAFTEGEVPGDRPVRTGTLWALAALTRTQIVYLLVLWVVLLLVDANNRAGLRRWLFGTLPAVIVYGSWLVFARLFFGTFWPRTLAVAPDSGARFGPDLWGQIQNLLYTETVLLGLMTASLVLVGRRILARRPTALAYLPALWVASLPFLLAARGAAPTPRYVLVALPVLAWLAWRAADEWWLGGGPEAPARRTQAAVLAFALSAIVVVQNLVVHRLVVVPEVRARTAAVREGLVTWGEWFGRHSPPQATIASSEVGALAYLSRRRVFDLTGVLSPELEAITRGRPAAIERFEYAHVARPSFLAHYAPKAFQLISRATYPQVLVPLGHGPAAASPDSVITFYRIDWTRFDTITGSETGSR